MRIKDIQIDRFGVWRDVTLPLNEHGVTVFYGPNEAGKSTLMRFVRGTLYGFNPGGRRLTRQGLSTEGKGALRITHDGNEHRISREADAGQRGLVRVDQLDWGGPSEDRIGTFLDDTSESIFENIFAIGLQELQELATLDGEEVAQHIYGLSLGLDGERILQARDALQRERTLRISDDHKSGEVVKWAQRIAAIDRELAELSDTTGKHWQLHAERNRLIAEIDQAEASRRDLEDNLRGCRFLQRVHGPWSRERALRQQQATFPGIGRCPDDALPRYDALTREIDNMKRRRSELRQEARRLYHAAGEKAGDSTLMEHECAIRRLAEERSDIRHRERRLQQNQTRADELHRRWKAKADKLGQSATSQRSMELPDRIAGIGPLLAAARAYRNAQTARKRTLSCYQKLVAASQKRQAAFNEQLKSCGGTSPERADEALHDQLAKLETLNRLCLEEARLSGQQQAPDRPPTSTRQPRKLIHYRDLPQMFYLVMWFFTMSGLTLFVLGLWGALTESVAAGNTAWIVGGIYSCFGLCMAGVTWTVRQHFEQFFEGGLVGDGTFSLKGTVDPPARHDPKVDAELVRVRTSIGDLVRRSNLPGLSQTHTSGGALITAELIERLSDRLAKFQQLRQQEARIRADRRRLSRYRDLSRQRQRDMGLQRRRWCEVLQQNGLDETLKVGHAIRQCQELIEAEELRRTHADLLKEIALDRDAVEAHRNEVRRLQERLGASDGETLEAISQGDQLLAGWVDTLNRSGGATDEQKLLRRQAREKRKAASTLQDSLRDALARRRKLMQQAGVSTREELEQCAQNQFQHRELTRQIEEAQLEVQLIAEEEPNLAVVEEDLLSFEPGENKRRITDSEIELQQLDRDLQTAREELGRVKRELAELAGDRSALSLRFERGQAAGKLRQAMERWAALELAIDSVDQIRHRMERHGQSETLQQASKYLSQLTVGRYRNIWSPLGERHLCIDDDTEQTLRVEQLSTGTREQLFLAIRLAMIRSLAQAGTELPLVLDDVFVNFDQARTEAAVETILDVAESGQQVLLFTCHLHLADIFESKGVNAVWLPENTATVVERKAG